MSPSQVVIEERIQPLLDSPQLRGNLTPLFCEVLGWGRPQEMARSFQISIPEHPEVTLTPVAQLGGLPVFLVDWPSSRLPNVVDRRTVHKALELRHHEHLLVYVTADGLNAAFVYARSRQSSKIELRTLPYTIGLSARTTIEQLGRLALTLDELGPTGQPPITAVLDKLDRAFDVDAVTREFFTTYQRIFDETMRRTAGLDGDRLRLFTQKLFNRLMFLLFLERKGWMIFGDRRDYLRALWEDYQRDRKANPDLNFYQNRLTLLFFSGLNSPTSETNSISAERKDFVNRLIGDVPYLNGGLFEQDADDKTPGLTISDEVFVRMLDDLFYRFNFTVTESTPLDLEVAVDPEMLGKVFEELVTGRHESGSYYTPKTVVAFMCQEALKGHLQTHCPAEDPVAIAQFVEERDSGGLHDPERVLEALRGITVCDPACGSGAYLLGMLHELLDLRLALFATRNVDHKTVYQRKLEMIERNLYGVDIDPFAVNIARLRLWLSLAVEYDGSQPEPLPNLDYKIEAGDSLIASPPNAIQSLLRKELIVQIAGKRVEYLTAHGGTKRRLKEEIDDLRQTITDLTFGGKPVTGFDWAVEFAEVSLKGGFDVILANPPYVRQELITGIKPVLKNGYGSLYSGTADLYVYFYYRGLDLLKPGGMLVFISSNQWFRANYGKKLRAHIANSAGVVSITDFGDLPVFTSATAYPMIFIARKGGKTAATRYTQVPSLAPPYPDVRAVIDRHGHTLPGDAIHGSDWALADGATVGRLRGMRATGIPLGEYVKEQIYYGVKTGFNTAFVIDGSKRAELIAADPKSAEIIRPLAVGRDIRKWCIDYMDRWLIFTRRGTRIDDYPAIQEYLDRWRTELEPKPREWPADMTWPGRKPGSYKWYEIQDEVAYYAAFDQPKIVFPDIAKEPRFALDATRTFFNDTTFLISTNDSYLLGVLNSRAVLDLYAKLSPRIRGGYLRYKRQYVQQIPIPGASPADRIAIADLVQRCLHASGQGPDIAEWETEINARVEKLYGVECDPHP